MLENNVWSREIKIKNVWKNLERSTKKEKYNDNKKQKETEKSESDKKDRELHVMISGTTRKGLMSTLHS